ncbi:DHA2 family efflux MFS transporter permease subunit [Marilutibacter chinensis]|uniref:DHA2 family efflux MFS transporter permease subunit n=1 Tax=Marilutibacter chinensis TaxID=2912247 RepID=A0ABS9HPV8_9GAMM|nr:DHA2 family efflux MFS transporter permease subunit [Lysobacter chinensis]MCF7220541.1 DHA2 family efflux MFS transporter permease subunit [Lysobacter chinensis]
MRHDLPEIPPRLWALAALTGAGAFMAMLDSTAANLALETIRIDLDVRLGGVQWVATGYLIALAVVLPVTGWLIRRFGHGRVWTAGLAGFIAASALCALSRDLPQLVVARILQGLAAGAMVPAGQAVLAAQADRRQLGRLMGSVGFAVALGPAFGPWLGGWLVEASWRWIFWLNLPVGALALLAARRWLPDGEANACPPPDLLGTMTAGLGLPLLLYGVSGHGEGGRGIGWLASGALLLVAFVVRTLRSQAPLLDLALLRRPGVAVSLATVALTGASMYGGLLLLPLYLQRGAGFGPPDAGALLLAMGIGSACALPLAGGLTDRVGATPVGVAGGGLLLLGTAPFLFAPASWALLPATVLLLVRGAGLALAQMPAMTAAYATAGRGVSGDAATLVNIAQRLGGAAGAVAVVALLERGGAHAYDRGFLLLAVLAAAAMFTALPLSRARGPA